MRRTLDKIKTIISFILIFAFACSMVSCGSLPYKEEDVLCEYPDLDTLYYAKNEYKEYKYSDYIIDDVSNGEYKTSTPSISDFKNGSGYLDYDIAAYVEARTDYALKVELIDKYEIKVDEICAKVRDDYFVERNAYVHYYDKNTKEDTLLYDGLVSNLSYDDEVPVIWFDVDDNADASDTESSLDGKKILLSDIIAANSTIDGYMHILLGANKSRYQFFTNKRVDNTEFAVATESEIQ